MPCSSLDTCLHRGLHHHQAAQLKESAGALSWSPASDPLAVGPTNSLAVSQQISWMLRDMTTKDFLSNDFGAC